MANEQGRAADGGRTWLFIHPANGGRESSRLRRSVWNDSVASGDSVVQRHLSRVGSRDDDPDPVVPSAAPRWRGHRRRRSLTGAWLAIVKDRVRSRFIKLAFAKMQENIAALQLHC